MSPRRRRAAQLTHRRPVLRVEQLEGRDLLAAGLLHIDILPNDASFGAEWGMNNTGQNSGKADADIDAPEAWNITTGSSKNVVAVIDTGIDYRHLDLYRNIWINQGEIPSAIRSRLTDIDGDGLITFWDLNDSRNQGSGKITDLNGNGYIDGGDILKPTSQNGWADGVSNDGDSFVDDLIGWNFVNNTNNPLDDNDHGTHVAGIIGAVGNNSAGVAGINWHIQLMAVKTMGANGTGLPSAAVAGLNYAVSHGAFASNNSYDGTDYHQEMYDAINNARANGHIFVAAAGNGGSDYIGDNDDIAPVYPAGYDLLNVVAVTATTRQDTLAPYGNYGKVSVDLGAPGSSIISTTRNNSYNTFSGTSMAVPNVTATLALVRTLHPDWKYYQLIDQVLHTTDPLSSLSGKTVSGGRVNAYKAVSVVLSDTTGAYAVSAIPNASGAAPVSGVRVTFSEGMNASTFGPGDVNLIGPNGAITGIQVVPVANSDDRSFDIIFPSQSAAGTYVLTLGTDIRDLAGNPLNQNRNAVNGEAGDVYSTSFVIEDTYNYTSTTAVPIPDEGTAIGSITINRDILIGDLNVQINVGHTFDNDLYIHLRSPDGTDVVLANRRGGSGQNFTNTLFDDEAATSIVDGTAPFSGSFQPDLALSAFDGKNARGTWQLVIEDRQAADTGTLNSWSLRFEAGSSNNTAPNSGARVVSITPNGTGLHPATSVRVTFSSAIDPTSFTLSDIVSFTGPNGAISVTAVKTVAGSGSTQFDLTFASQSTPGTYQLVLGPDIRDAQGSLMDQNQNGVNGETTLDRYTGTFSLNSVLNYVTGGVNIADNATTIIPLSIGDDRFLTDINVQLTVTHPAVADLYIHLRGPDGTDVLLFNRRGGTGANLKSTLFDDRATTPISSGAAPFTATFRPETPLSALLGKNVHGTWQLVIEDRAAGNKGRLNLLTVNFEMGPATTSMTKVQKTSSTFRTSALGDDLATAEEVLTSNGSPTIGDDGVSVRALDEDGDIAPVIPDGVRQEVTTASVPRVVDQVFSPLRKPNAGWMLTGPEGKAPTLEDLLAFFQRGLG